jgi:hypothetical protein
MNVTLDRFMEGSHRELDHTAHVVDEDFDRSATDMLEIDRRDSPGARDLSTLCRLTSRTELL